MPRNPEPPRWLLFDWGDTLMADDPTQAGPMAFWPTVAAMPGVAETLPLLAARYFCAVVSNAGDSDGPLMRQAFARVGLEPYFQRFLTSKELGAQKPDPEFFRAALRVLGCTAAQACMVGNDPAKDVDGARAAGLRAVLVAPGEFGALANLSFFG